MNDAVRQRERAIDRARIDFGEALALAQAVAAPWYRCQALAWVARFAPADRVGPVAREAAAQGDDSYLRSASLAWPIRALVERRQTSAASQLLSEAVTAARRIEHPVQRIDALWLIAQASWPLGGAAQAAVAETLAGACRQARSWRAGAILRDLALLVAREDPQRAAADAALLPEGRYRRQCLRALGEGRSLAPRRFFW